MIYEVEELTFCYPKREKPILQEVSFSLEEGEILTILGKNGAGKSTLLRCLLGLLKPQQGKVRLNGMDIFEMQAKKIASLVSYVPQSNAPAFDYTVFHYVQMGRAHQVSLFGKPNEADEKIVWEALEQVGITYLAEKFYTELSGGEQQQAAIARALAQEPKVILFDEPTAHLDLGKEYFILKQMLLMLSKQYTILMTTHNPEHALLFEAKTAILNQEGRLQVGRSHDIITEARLQELYGIDLKLLYVKELNRYSCFLPELTKKEVLCEERLDTKA